MINHVLIHFDESDSDIQKIFYALSTQTYISTFKLTIFYQPSKFLCSENEQIWIESTQKADKILNLIQSFLIDEQIVFKVWVSDGDFVDECKIIYEEDPFGLIVLSNRQEICHFIEELKIPCLAV